MTSWWSWLAGDTETMAETTHPETKDPLHNQFPEHTNDGLFGLNHLLQENVQGVRITRIGPPLGHGLRRNNIRCYVWVETFSGEPISASLVGVKHVLHATGGSYNNIMVITGPYVNLEHSTC